MPRKQLDLLRRKLAPLKDAQGNLIHDKSKQTEGWAVHYGQLYGEGSEIDIDKIEQLPSFHVIPEINRLPTFDEMIEAVKQIPNDKSPGNDAIPAEAFKCIGDTSLSKLYEIATEIWREEKVSQDLQDSKCVQLYKSKEDKSDCNNYHGISLLNIFSKIASLIILPKLQALGQRIYPESQCRPGRSTTDMILSVRQIQEKCRENNIPLYMAFVDLTKALDKASRDGLYIILSKLGCREKLLNIIKSFHDSMKANLIY